MKFKKLVILTFLFTLVMGVRCFASEKKTIPEIFMGKVVNIEESESKDVLRVRVIGYLKGCEVYEDEIIGIINQDTIIIPSIYSCNEDEINTTKVNLENFELKTEDVVFCVLDEAMTKSIPPQVRIKAIQISPQIK